MKRLLFLALISLTVLFFASCSKDSGQPMVVKYNVSSSSTMNVTYTDADGTLKTANNVTSSWTYSFNTPASGQIVKLIIVSTNGSAVNGSIYINGQQSTQDNSATGSVTLTAQVP